MIWGPNDLPDGTSAFPTYQRLGVDVLQMQLTWREVASRRPAAPGDPADGAYTWPASVDRALRETQARGMQLALLVKGTPDWANAGRGPARVPDDVGDFAAFMQAASRRYAPVRHWMIWGEPTRGDSFEPMPADSPVGPRAYARVARRSGRVEGLGWYELTDDGEPDGLTAGLLTADGRPKPAFEAYRRVP